MMDNQEIQGFIGAMDDKFRVAIQEGNLRSASTVIGVVAGIVVASHPHMAHSVYGLVHDAQEASSVDEVISIYRFLLEIMMAV